MASRPQPPNPGGQVLSCGGQLFLYILQYEVYFVLKASPVTSLSDDVVGGDVG